MVIAVYIGLSLAAWSIATIFPDQFGLGIETDRGEKFLRWRRVIYRTKVGFKDCYGSYMVGEKLAKVDTQQNMNMQFV